MEPADSFAVGDFCFAQVNPSPWWPSVIANVMERKTKKGSKFLYSVDLYGTNGSALLPPKDLMTLTSDSIEKCVTKAALRRKHYKEGLRQMLKESGFQEKNYENAEEEKLRKEPLEFELTTFEEDRLSKDKFLACLGLNGTPAEATTSAQSEDGTASPETPTIMPEFDDLDEEVESIVSMLRGNQSPETFYCMDCCRKFVCETTFKMHNFREHNKIDEEDSDDDDDELRFGLKSQTDKSDSSKKPKNMKKKEDKKAPTKRKKVQAKSKKQNGNSKLVKSLREDELEGMRMFMENIETRDSYYICKLCSHFSTTTKLLAKVHAVSCKKTKKKGRPAKKSECLLCHQQFCSLKEMHKHHYEEHSTQKYSCSTCHKTFNRRQAYSRHLSIHKEAPKLQCPVSGCVKVFRFNCNLKRHIKTHEVSPLHIDIMEFQEGSNDFVNYEIDLEEKRTGRNHSGKFTVKELSSSNYKRNHTSLLNSLGYTSLEDWDVHVEISNSLVLPLSGSTDPEAVETCIYIDELGAETFKFAWNSAPQTAFSIASQIVTSLVDEAVQHSSLDDPNVSDGEILDIVDSILINAEHEKKIQESNTFFGSILGHSDLEGVGLVEVAVEEDLVGVEEDMMAVEEDLVAELEGSEGAVQGETGRREAGKVPGGCQAAAHTDGDEAAVRGSIEGRESVVVDSDGSDGGNAESVQAGCQPTALSQSVRLPPGEAVLAVPQGVLTNSSAVNGGTGNVDQSKKGLTCPQCGALGINGMSKLMLHVERMHSKPYTCNICKVQFVDRYHFNLHSSDCFYMCPVDGCNFQEKRESRLKGHLRRHRFV